MAAKKSKKSSKAMDKKSMKKTKGGILIGLNQPTTNTFVKIDSQLPAVQTGDLNFLKITY
jgi:hypothetical protein